MSLRSQILASGQSPLATAAITGGGAVGLVALGTTQANALQLNASFNTITTSSASTGVLLFACEEGASQHIFNNSGQTITVYPHEATGVTINNGATSFSLSNGKTVSCFAPSYNTWVTNLSA